MESKINKFSYYIFILSFFLAGLYFEGYAALVGVLLLVVICILQYKKALYIRLDFTSLLVCVIFILYAISIFWAVDRGIAAWGIVKFLPVFGFTIICANISSECRDNMISSIPIIGCVMTIASIILQFIPYFHENLMINGRLGGFFEYPNTFCAFLMFGLIVAIIEDRHPVVIFILLSGMLLSGSRTVLILSVPFIVSALIFSKNKKNLTIYMIMMAVGVAAGLGIGALIGGSSAGHISAITTNTSTFWERVLYWKDALPIVGTHPFGLGYLGYYMVQASYATGVYATRWVHNDLLQLALDVGFVPVILALIAVFRALFKQNSNITKKILLLALSIHCLFDFDLQFSAMYFILILCLIDDDAKVVKFGITKIETIGASIILAVFSIIILFSSTFYYNDMPEMAMKVYKWNTFAQIALLNDAEGSEKLKLSEDIAARNEYVSSAFITIAKEAARKGDFDKAVISGRKAIYANPYDMRLYREYFDILRVGVDLYRASGDTEGANICLDEIKSIHNSLIELEENVDDIAKTLPNAPVIYEPNGLVEYLKIM